MQRLSCTTLALAFLLAACQPEVKNPAITPQQAAQAVRHGYELIDSGQPEEAIHVFDQLIAVAPENASAYNGKGVAFDHAGNHLAAQELYQRALAISPDSIAIRNNLAMSLILNNQIDEAVALLEALNEHSSNKTVRQNLALAYGLKGDSDKALKLNLQDVTPEQAKENMQFYQSYALRLKKMKTSGLTARSQIGFEATPVTPLPAPEKAADKPENSPEITTSDAPEKTQAAEKSAPPGSDRASKISEPPKEVLQQMPAPAADEPPPDNSPATAPPFPTQYPPH